MSDNIAPAGKIWMCAACGKKARDQYGTERGWDESCALNSYLVDEANPVLGAELVRADRERHEENSRKSFARLIAGEYETSPELLELAQRAVDARKAATGAKREDH